VIFASAFVAFLLPVSAAEARVPHLSPRLAPTGRPMIVTAYCPCRKCCGPHARGVTASGKKVRRGMCAADKSIPFGTVFNVPGYGRAVVDDRGGAIRGNRLDVYFPTHAQARAWGRRTLTITIRRMKCSD
jgi:3D (Asp-Asp-Asp) domain-containing protein